MTDGVYLRMSLDKTGEELGIDRQREGCKPLAKNGAREYVDNDISASSGRRRPDYERLLADIERGEIDRVVAWSLDRLVRRLADLERLVDICERHRVRVALTRGSEIDLSTPAGRLVARLLGSVARHEIEQKSDRQRAAARQRAKRGMPASGPKAFGYAPGGMTLIEGEADALRGAYGALLAGRTLSGIAGDLNKAGHRTGRGGLWKHNAVRLLLQNPRNAGLRAHRGEVVCKAAWPAVVSEEVWRAVCARLAEPTRRTNHVGSARKHLGTRRYRCGRCRAAERESLVISTYRDNGRRIYRCPQCYLTRGADQVDTYVEAVIEERLGRKDAANLLARSSTVDVKALYTEAQALRERREEARVDYYVNGRGTKREYDDTRDRIDEKLADISGQLAQTATDKARAELLGADSPVAAWRATAGQVDRRGTIVDALLTVTLLKAASGVRILDPDTVKIEWV